MANKKDNKKKEVGNKKHILTRIIVGALLVVGAGAISLASVFAFTTGIYITFAELALVIAAGTTVGGVAMMAKGVKGLISDKINKEVSINSINQIANIDRNNLQMEQSSRAKLIKKYAKANLKLCKSKGCPFVGKFKAQSDFSKDKEIEAFNDIENYEILKNLSTSTSQQKKYAKKINKIKSNIPSIEDMKLDKRKYWTKSYDNVVNNMKVYDRRLEIKSLSTDTVTKFAKMTDVMDLPEKGDMGGFINVSYSTKSGERPTYVKIANTKYLPTMKDLMINDVIKYCENNEDATKLFPLSIDVCEYDSKTRVQHSTVIYDSLEELKSKDNSRLF